MSVISISDFSSLNFRTDWKLGFQKNECYEQRFLPDDVIRVQYTCAKAGEYIPYLKNCNTGEVISLPFENILEDEEFVISEFTIVPGNLTEDTLFYVYFAKSENEEAVLATYFQVCMELENTVSLKYTHRRDDFGTVFSESRLYCFRVEGSFLPQEISFENESEDFRDQRFVAKTLSDFTYEKKTLTIGGGFGVPNWVARKINLIFSLSAVYVNEQPMVRSEGSSVKINLLHNDYPLYIYKIELENTDDSLTINDPLAVEFSRVIDEKKKLIRRCSENEVRVYDELGAAFNPETAKMIHELDTILELSENYLIEIDDNKSENTYKTTLNSVILLFAKEFLSKKHEDTADAVITFLKGLKVGNYLPGLTGTGARIDEQGYAELTGLTLREFLEAPEYRFNRVDVVSGEQWNAPGFGLIESVDVENCIATLKLEDQELAGIRVGDLCRGLFHNLAGNADGAVTDSCGFLTVAGFSTSYFTPAELLEDGKSFRYELKPGTVVHPSPAMKFAAYGNFTDKSRQASAYSTRTYKRYLKEVNTWEIDPQRNIAMQFGDLSGLYINGVDMSGYSAWLNNIYFSGHVEWTPGQLEEIRGKDGYSVNLTSYDAVVAVDSQGRIDNSVYDIINVVNGSELVQSAGMQVVTTRYKIQTEIQAYRGQVRLEHSDSPGEGMYTAAFTAKGCEYSFAAGVLTVTKITEDKAGVEIEVNCEGAATFTMKFVLTRVYSGEAGPEGMISRVSEWAEGFYYRNDTETETGSLRYLDIVVVTDRSTGNFACYQAKAAHNGVASSELNRPGNEAFWTRMSQLPPIYTPLILAENGVIRFAQSNQLLIQKEDGTVTAGASGKGSGAGGIRFWAGSEDPARAPWRVDETGKMVADNADITGRITANSGKIGGFGIGDIYLESGGLRLSAGEIRYDDNNVLIHMGTEFGEGNTLACLYIKNNRVSTGAAMRMCARFISPSGEVSIGDAYALGVSGNVLINGETILNGETTITGALIGRGIGPAPHDMRHLVIDTSTGRIYHD